MRVTGLDGRGHNMRLVSSPRADASAPHRAARELLERLYPAEQRLEEVALPGTGGLTADFYLPGRRLMVEVQGRQHSEYVPHFHGPPTGFVRSAIRDSRKAEFAGLNGMTLVELPEGRRDEWEGLLR